LLISSTFQAKAKESSEDQLKAIYDGFEKNGLKVLKDEETYKNFINKDLFSIVIYYQPSCPYCQSFGNQFPSFKEKIKAATDINLPVGILVCDDRDTKILEFCES